MEKNKKKEKAKCLCETKEPLWNTVSNFDINIENSKLKFSYSAYSCDSSFDDELNIKFCPLCGKSLTSC